MISNLVSQLGLEVTEFLDLSPSVMLDIDQRTYNVFHVGDAVGSDFIVAGVLRRTNGHKIHGRVRRHAAIGKSVRGDSVLRRSCGRGNQIDVPRHLFERQIGIIALCRPGILSRFR